MQRTPPWNDYLLDEQIVKGKSIKVIGAEMKPLLQNRVLMLGLALSFLLHGILLLSIPESAFMSGKVLDARPDMELRFILRNRLSAVSQEDASLNVEEIVSLTSGRKDEVERTGSMQGNTEKFPPYRQTESKAQPAFSVDSTSDSVGSEVENDSRSVVFRRSMGRQSSFVSRPVITISTRDPVYAMYYRTLRSRIEHIGAINFPQQNGSRLYGELTVRIPVYRNGAIDDREGGVSIERSSGNPSLDNAALRIVYRAAPFGSFPKSAQTAADVWVIITRLKFTRDQGSRQQIQSTVR